MKKSWLLLAVALVTLAVAALLLWPVKYSGREWLAGYRQVSGWPKLPPGMVLGNPAGLGLDTSGNLVVFHRADRRWRLLAPMQRTKIEAPTVLVIDRKKGSLLESWGGNLFIMPHGLTVDCMNNIWVTDVGLHQVFKFSHGGKLLMQVGMAGIAGNDSLHFNMPTDVAVAADGSFYVSDGYGNNRVCKFSAAGKFLFSWGEKGKSPGKFNLPHALALDRFGRLYVADRENRRIQLFDAGGKWLGQWSAAAYGDFCSVFVDGNGTVVYAVDDASILHLKHRGSDVYVFNRKGKLLQRFGRSGGYNGPATWYHDLVADKEGNVFVGDILNNRLQRFEKIPEE